MLYKVILLLTAVLIGTNIYAQNEYYFDSITYSNYLKQEWKELLENSKHAKKENVQFYYASYRTGIAYYELGNYMKAIPYFKNVIEEGKADIYTYSYLYYSYLLSGYEEKAEDVKKNMPELMKSELSLPKKNAIKNGIVLWSTSNYTIQNYQHNFFLKKNPVYGETAVLPSHTNTLFISSEQRIGAKFRCEEAITNLTTQNFQSFYHNSTDSTFFFSSNQKQAFLKISYWLGSHYRLKLSGHYLNGTCMQINSIADTSYSTLYDSEMADTLIEGNIYKQIKNYSYFNIPSYSYHTVRIPQTYHDYLFSAGLDVKIGYFENSLNYSYSSLLGSKYHNFNLYFTYYPFGNFNTFLHTLAIIKGEQYFINTLQHLVLLTVGRKITKHVRASVTYASGSINNHSMYNGMAVFNYCQKLKSTAGIDVNVTMLENKIAIGTSFEINRFSQNYYVFEETGSQTKNYNGMLNYRLVSNEGSAVFTQNYPFSYNVTEPTYSIKDKELFYTNKTIKIKLIWYF